MWWRHRGLAPNDVMLASYPRSGSTWLRFTLFEILTGEPSSFDKVNAALRGMSDYRRGWRLLPNGGRFIGTHEPYRLEYPKSVYLVRDVRDVALSEFAFEQNLGIGRASMDEYLRDLLHGHKRHGSWQDHVQSWLNCPLAQNGRLLLIRYEDLRNNSEDVLGEILNFLGVSVRPGVIQNAVANNTVQRMREKEDKLYREGSYSQVPRRPQKGVEAGGRFVRSGSVGGWQGRLNGDQLQLIDQCAGATLAKLGYPRATEAPVELVPTVSS